MPSECQQSHPAAASAKQRSKCFRPMPGSIKISTTPALSSANTSSMNPVPNGTSIAIRIPGFTPQASSPRAIASLRESRPPNVVKAVTSRPITLRRSVGLGNRDRSRCKRRYDPKSSGNVTVAGLIRHDPLASVQLTFRINRPTI